MLSEAQPAPDFSLPNQDNKSLSLSDFSGKNVVIYFYPKDNTSGCTIESKEFSDLKKDYEENNAIIPPLSLIPNAAICSGNGSGSTCPRRLRALIIFWCPAKSAPPVSAMNSRFLEKYITIVDARIDKTTCAIITVTK